MATGKPPWSQQYQEVAALFHIGTTKSHPPIPEHLSSEAKDFLLKCLQKEPNLRPSASDLLQHPFVAKDVEDSSHLGPCLAMDSTTSMVPPSKTYTKDISFGCDDHSLEGYFEHISDLRPIWDKNINDDDDLCQIFENNTLPTTESSFNPMLEPLDELSSKSIANYEQLRTSKKAEIKCIFPCEPTYEEDDEIIESRIRAFLDEKAFELKKLQTPLYEEFFNSLSAIPEEFDRNARDEYGAGINELCSKSTKPSLNKITGNSNSKCAQTQTNGSPKGSKSGLERNSVLQEIPSVQLNEWGGGLLQGCQLEADSPRLKKWREELDQELEKQREIRQASGIGKISPLNRCGSRRQDRMLFMSPGK
ncbi:hypothetical protein HPP92_019440 [Vanilla planifolia]|uniref:Protein kinase domain-containing protein n=1 Tax=Vanilla planifolia TaxID=51239 RepID=A0A835Q2V6_VANPL|nr:hypothetical protein HPP92_019440 [Vanilla planifolia]